GVVATIIELLGIVCKSAGVCQQMTDVYVSPTGRDITEVFSDLVVEVDLAFFYQKHYRECRELFTDGAGLEDRLGFYRHIVLDVRKAVAFDNYRLAVLDHRKRNAGYL